MLLPTGIYIFRNLRRPRWLDELRRTLPGEYGVSPRLHGPLATLSFSFRYRRNREFQRQWLILGSKLYSAHFAVVSDSLVHSLSLVYLSEIRVMNPGQDLGRNVMKRANSRRRSDLENDLKRLRGLAYHRLENSADLIRKFHRFRRINHGDSNHLQKLYDWLFVPITLWPIDIEGLLRTALDRVASGKRLDNRMLLLIDL